MFTPLLFLLLPLIPLSFAILVGFEENGLVNVLKKKHKYLSDSGVEYNIYITKDQSEAVIKGKGFKKTVFRPTSKKIIKEIEEIESMSKDLDFSTVELPKK